MSWFKRRPRRNEPQKHLPHHRSSPAARRMFEEAKKTAPEQKQSNQDKL